MQYKKFIGFEVKYLLNWRFIVVILVFFLMCGYFLQLGINQYFHIQGEKENFQRFESEKLKQFVYLSQYGDYGLRLFFAPSPFMAFFDGGPIPDLLIAFIDTSERMEIFQPLKSQNAFARFNTLFMNFAGFVLLFGSLLVLFYGYDTFRWKEWLKFLESKFKNRTALCLYLTVSRILIVFLICFLLGVLSVLLFIINGASIKVVQVLIYSLFFFVLLLYFLIIGFCCGAAKSRFKGTAALVVSWFLLAFIIPMLICQWTFSRAASIESVYKMEERKLKTFMDYERTSFEEAGKFDASKRGSQKEKDMFMAFWNSGFKGIIGEEEKILNSTKEYITFYQNLSSLFPSTFYLSVSSEMSSRGFSSMVGFNEYTQGVKKDFFWFRAENYIFSDKKEFQPFFKGSENIYQGQSQLPVNFAFGMLVTVLWLAVLFILFWIKFNRVLDRASETEKELCPEDIKKNNTNVIFTTDKGLLPQLISKLSFHKISFVSVPCPSSLPGDTKVKNLLSLFDLEVPETLEKMSDKYIYDLEPDDKGRVLTEIVRSLKADVIIFNNFLAGLSDELIVHFAEVIKPLKEGRVIVYFTNSMLVNALIGDCGIKWTDEKMAF